MALTIFPVNGISIILQFQYHKSLIQCFRHLPIEQETVRGIIAKIVEINILSHKIQGKHRIKKMKINRTE